MAETPSTPEAWLPVLAKRLDDDVPRVRLLKRYREGDAPLPEGGENVRASWQRFQREARTNWAELILEAVASRIVPSGITVAGSADHPLAVQAQRIWRDNRMNAVVDNWVRDGLSFRRSYLTVWTGDDGRAVVTADSPETMYAATDPLRPWRVRAAIRVWRDEDEERDYAMVWTDGGRQKFWRPSTNQKGRLYRTVSGGKWEAAGDPVVTDGRPPITVFNHPNGKGEYESHLDLINRINRGVLHRLVIEAMEAYRQRAIKAGDHGLPKTDPDGNEIDYSKVFAPAPGALWELPPGVEIWESQTTDIRPLLDGARDDLRQLASVSRTPLPMLMPDSANQSAQGALQAAAAYLSKCEARAREAQLGITACLVDALRAEGAELGEADTVEVTMTPVDTVSMAERYSAAAQAKAAGVPVRTIWREVLGWSPQQIKQAELDAANERLAAGVFNFQGLTGDAASIGAAGD